jgi:hypothetical protein
MTPDNMIAAVVGLIVLTWAHGSDLATWAAGLGKGLTFPSLPPLSPDEPVALSYQSAIEDLANVRSRLKATGCLKDDQLKAMDTLTLALVAGSDL